MIRFLETARSTLFDKLRAVLYDKNAKEFPI